MAQNRMCVIVFLPEHHHYPVGSSHLHVPGGNGVLLPLLCRLLLVPLPVSVQEGTRPGQESKTPDCTTTQTLKKVLKVPKHSSKPCILGEILKKKECSSGVSQLISTSQEAAST